MKGLRILLFPFSIVYDGITRIRNWGFDQGILNQESFDIPVIAVGNLSTGGTGKSPMIEFLVRQNRDRRIGILSRGYDRYAHVYKEVEQHDNVRSIGDEPLQFKKQFKDLVVVSVSDKRSNGIKRLINSHELDLILLDDAFQHRYVKAQQYLLLTDYYAP